MSMYEAGSAFQLWLFSSLLLFSLAVGENIWKGFPRTGENFQANETLPAQLGTPTPAICSRCHYRVCERNLAVSSSSKGTSVPRPGGWLGARVPGYRSMSLPFLPFSAGKYDALQFHRCSEGLSKVSDEGRGCPGGQKQYCQSRIFSSSLGDLCPTRCAPPHVTSP